jgi:hypothetical protein
MYGSAYGDTVIVRFDTRQLLASPVPEALLSMTFFKSSVHASR